MKSTWIITWIIYNCVTYSLAQITNYPTIGQINRIDVRFNELVPNEAKIEVLAGGFTWSEGPIWIKREGYLLFSDVPENAIFKWTEKEGVKLFLKPSGYTGLGAYGGEPGSNGLTVNSKGWLVACEHGDRRVTEMPLDGSGGKRTLTDNYAGKRYCSPNDVVAHSDGSYYFTDPPYGMRKGENDPNRETDGYGVYRIAPERNGQPGAVTLLVNDLTRPNGIALSPDEKILYVAQSDPKNPLVMAYSLQADGKVVKKRKVFGSDDMKKYGFEGGFDGMKVDRSGNLWVTGANGVLVMTEKGELLGHINVGNATANCTWGDDGSTLYITADMYLCRIKTTTKGW